MLRNSFIVTTPLGTRLLLLPLVATCLLPKSFKINTLLYTYPLLLPLVPLFLRPLPRMPHICTNPTLLHRVAPPTVVALIRPASRYSRCAVSSPCAASSASARWPS